MSQIIAIDQGTSSSRCIVYDELATLLASAQQEFRQYYPKLGWVEHDPEEIWQSQISVLRRVISELNAPNNRIAGIGITNQRETTIVWDRLSGKPIYNAIVWQDRRTADTCLRLKEKGMEPILQDKTGLLADPYFSATKIGWILDHVDGARTKANRGELAFGTVDSWLIWKLTQGQLHITDVTNASRTLLFNIRTLQWDEELLELFGIPLAMLPTVKSSSEIYGKTSCPEIDSGIPIAAIAGDQHAALFGQLCLEAGMTKCTYGTGAFLMMNTGPDPVPSRHRLLTTIAWQIGDEISYALEGSIFTAGSIIQWLRDGLAFFDQAVDCEALAASVDDNGGIFLVPALTGLGAPHWDPDARGTLLGITRDTRRGHITRAALESIGFQVNELLQCLREDSGRPISSLRVDGGAIRNNLLAQFQADISAIQVIRPGNLESSALGAAFLAGIATGVWKQQDLQKKWRIDRTFHGKMPSEQINSLTLRWTNAVEKAKRWAI